MPSPVLSEVLTVCTGNVCRSPAAERLLALRLGSTVQVRSAGTHALVGQPMSPPMDALVAGAGALADGFAARRLQASMISADLVLTMTREQRSWTVELVPAALRRIFTLKQYAYLLELLDPSELPAGPPGERLRASVPLVMANHGRTSRPVTEDDVPDPYRRGDAAYAAAFEEIEQATRTIGRVLTGG